MTWIPFNNTWQNFKDANLNNPGTIINTHAMGSNIVEKYLIGDINPLAGTCDCCDEFRNEKIIVIEYKSIYNLFDTNMNQEGD